MHEKSGRTPAATLVLAGISACGACDVAFSQQAGGATNAQGAPAVEEITVTARRREESLQQVPISIEAFSDSQMEMRGIERVEDVVAQTPNVFVTQFGGGSGSSRFAMRGIPDVGFFVDGIWQQSSALLMNRSTLEVERVEVLRGPQGTLYGRDTTGGAIRLYTQRPKPDFGARVTITAGSFDRLDIGANIDIPITDTFLTKWTAVREERDGYMKSLTVDRSYGEVDDRFLRGDLLWTPSDKFNVRLIAEDSLQQTTEASGGIVIVDPGEPGPGPGLGFVVPARQFYEMAGYTWNNISHATGWPGGEVGKWETKSHFDQGHGTFVDAQALTLNMAYDVLDNFSVTSLTGYREEVNSYTSDFGASEFDFFTQQGWDKSDYVTQEFQLAGDHGRINWVGGLYGWRINAKSRTLRWSLTDLDLPAIFAMPECQVVIPGLAGCTALPNTDTFTGSKQEGYAVFGEVTFDLTKTLALTLGGRHHDQTNENWNEIFAPGTPRRRDIEVPGQRVAGDYFGSIGRTGFRSVSFEADTYRFALTNQFTDTLMAYAGYAEGFNSGGESRTTVQDLSGVPHELRFPYEPEQVQTYEIGVRSDWLDGRLRVNVTAFKTEWVGLQQGLEVRNPYTGQLVPSTVTQNVGEAEAKGVELSVIARPIRQLTLEAGLGTLDTGYVSILPGVTAVRVGDRFGQAPELQYSLGAQWDLAMSNGGEATFRLDYNWTDDYIRSYAPDTQLGTLLGDRSADQEAFGLLNARAAYKAASGQWELAVFGTNLTNEWYVNGGFSPAVLAKDQSRIARPREGGVTFKLFFE